MMGIFLETFPRGVDRDGPIVHFWDPMMNRFALANCSALKSAANPLAGSMTITTIITTTTHMRGASG